MMGPIGRTQAALALGLCALAVTVSWAGSQSSALRATRAGGAVRGFAGLPLAARGPVSAALGADLAGYRIHGLSARNPAQRLSAQFAAGGVSIQSGGSSFGLALRGFGRGGALRAIPQTRPVAAGNRVSYPDGGVGEWWTNGPLGLEQGFVVPVRPAGESGALTLSLGLSGDLHARPDDGSVLLGDGLRYGGLVATDARGRTLPSRLALSEGRILIEVNDSGARYPVHVDPIVQQAELTAAGGAADDNLGDSVAISGDEIVAGAPLHEVGANANQGAVYVFVGSGSSWTQTAELTASDGDAGDELGSSVAISGDEIVAGAPDHTVGEQADQGAVYVFVGSGSSWTQTELTALDGAAIDQLGTSVAISGDEIVAGAPNHIGPNANAGQGATYVFVGSGSSWTQKAQLTASNGAAEAHLGSSVAVFADTIVAGAPGQTSINGDPSQGAAYVFVELDTGWANASQNAELTASDGAPGDMLGSSVAISDTGIVAGAPLHTVGANFAQGAAYVFVGSGNSWTQKAELTASDGAAHDQLGVSVGMFGGTVVAGAYDHKVGANAGQGAAYVFAERATGWANATQTDELTASDGAAVDSLGAGVGVSGDTIVAGAPDHKVGGHAGQGAAYVFETPPTISITSPANLENYARGEVVHASYACAASPPATISSCTGPVADGALVNTSTPGVHTFTVLATDNYGGTASETVTYVVLIRPSLGGVGQSRNVWREGNKLASISSADKKKPPVGTTFKFTLSEPGTVKLVFTQRGNGRQIRVRDKRKCVAPTKHNERDRACKRTVTAGTLKLKAPAGKDKIAFDGRISAHHKLAPGTYTVTITATDALGQNSKPSKLTFTIVR